MLGPVKDRSLARAQSFEELPGMLLNVADVGDRLCQLAWTKADAGRQQLTLDESHIAQDLVPGHRRTRVHAPVALPGTKAFEPIPEVALRPIQDVLGLEPERIGVTPRPPKVRRTLKDSLPEHLDRGQRLREHGLLCFHPHSPFAYIEKRLVQ